MTDSFNPYLKWLGIRELQRPVNHYRLLGVELFEEDMEVISSAADRQIRHVQSQSEGPQANACQLLLIELEAARACLLNPESQATYRERLEAPSLLVHENAEPPPPGLPTVRIDTQRTVKSLSGREVPPASGQLKARIQSGRSRRKKNSGMADFFGWLLGGVVAVVFAAVLLNAGLIDRIRGRINRADNQPARAGKQTRELQTDAPAAFDDTGQSSGLRSGPRSGRRETAGGIPRVERIQSASQPNSFEAPETIENDLIDGSNAPTPFPTKVVEPTAATTTTKKLPVPDKDLLAEARQELRKKHRAQFGSDDAAVKQSLAGTLLSGASNGGEAPNQYVMLESAAEIASSMGDLRVVISAIGEIDRRFDIDLVEMLARFAGEGLANSSDLERVGAALIELFQLLHDRQAFGAAAELSDQAARIARKQADPLQQDMLANYSRDLKALEIIHRKFVAIDPQLTSNGSSNGSERTSENLTIGKYWCYCRDDWKQGLPFMATGDDRQLASIAKLDIGLVDNDNASTIAVANEWFHLRTKPKYKGLDRRCIALRAIELYDRSAGSPAFDSLSESNRTLLRIETQIVKQFVADRAALASRTVVFDVDGWRRLDKAQLEQGTVLRLGMGQISRPLPVREADGVWQATTEDRQTHFRIRPMEHGLVEMRLFDATTGALMTILYGK